ncbi:hypothetical protein [Neisseria sp.]|uniref:hypothetical protein n=1 Tax=Neisseria sp. TaxID=192066 RepID=UPI0035A006EB
MNSPRKYSVELASKELGFLIRAVEFQISYFELRMADPDIHEDDYADVGNDLMLLKNILAHLREEEQTQNQN